MSEQFLHGVEVVEIDAGPRPIQTVRTSVIAAVGTAPDSAPEVKASLSFGLETRNTGLTATAKLPGAQGNRITLRLVDPGEPNAGLEVSVSGLAITARLATDADGIITTTAAQLSGAINSHPDASQLVQVANTGTSTGAGVVSPLGTTALAGGVDEAFPLNTPVLVAGSRAHAAKLGRRGTLPVALDSIFDQAGAVVIVVRVAEGADEAATLANVIGGVHSETGQYEGVHALLGAEARVGFAPRILIAPGFTHQRPNGAANPVVAELVGIAERLRATIIADGPNTTDEAAIEAAGDFGSPRVYLVDPWVRKLDANGIPVDVPPSAAVAGLIAKSDNDRGFWWSPSNQTINGIIGTSRPVDFALNDPNSRANLLNEKKVATIIRQDGFRLWGNRTLSADPRWAFLSVRRTADVINDSVLRAHMWAVDRNITKTYIEDVTDGVNAYLRRLVGLGAILGGICYADPDLNTPANIAQGRVFFDFDFTPPYPAERVTFRSHLVNDYLSEIA